MRPGRSPGAVMAGWRGPTGVMTRVLMIGLLLAAVTGCSLWQPSKAAAPTPGSIPAPEPDQANALPEDAASAAGVRVRGVPSLVVEAPAPLDALLGRYLDLARALALPDAAQTRRSEWNRLIAAIPAQARELAQTEGLFDAQVEVLRESRSGAASPLADDPGDWLLRVRVTPGPSARVGRLTLEFEGELATLAEQGDAEALALRQRLLAQWPLQPGTPFRNGPWGDAKNAVLAQLRAAGYATATWAGTGAQVAVGDQQVRLFLVADTGPLFRAGPLHVEGLVHHDEPLVRALAGWAPGTPLTETRLLDYQDRLVKTGLFDQVSVTLEPEPTQAGAATVHVLLKEARLQSASVAVGVSANSGPRTTLEHSHRRVFGLPLIARNKLEWGLERQAWDGELSTQPDAKLRRWVLGGAVERLPSDTDVVLSQRLRASRVQSLTERDRSIYVELERANECSRQVGGECDELRALSTHVTSTWRQLDSQLLPTQGHTFSLQAGLGWADGTPSRTDAGLFARLYGRATGYWPVGERWFAQARVEAGAILSRDAVVAPDSQRFRAGGDESVRGYAWRSLAPTQDDGSLTGGRLLFTASAEIARPISPDLPAVWWALFVDAGRAADDWRDLSPALGYGAGVRWRSPVGPLKLDLAWGQEVQALRLHLSVGIAF